MKSVYRPDIDGLRAIAIGIVLLFHADIGPFAGGFIGVDIFLVLSGYLITRIICNENGNVHFSIITFYERRLRRIFPALAVTVAITLAIAPLVLYPGEVFTTAFTAIAALSSSANLYLLNSRGYFGEDTVSQPLIHTWSLGVEEQFYLLFPYLFVAFGAARRNAARYTVLMAAVASFVGCIVLTVYNRDIAYYFTLTRAWELLIGSVVALFPTPRFNRWLREFLAASCFLLIITSSIRFHPSMNFPGFLAAIPCIAVAVLIMVGGVGGSIVTTLLSSKPLVAIGRISYSLYLWHWPIIVYALLIKGSPLTIAEKIGILTLTLITSFFSWKFIEEPCRVKALFREQMVVFKASALAYLVLCLSAVGLMSYFNRPNGPIGEGERLAKYLNYNEAEIYRRGSCFLFSHLDKLSDYDKSSCMTNSKISPNLLLIGDSHAAHLWIGLESVLGSRGIHVMQATATGCKPTISPRGERVCRNLMALALKALSEGQKPDFAVFSARWHQSDIPMLLETITALRGLVKQIIVFGPIVEYYRPLSRLVGQVADGRDESLLVSARNKVVAPIDVIMQEAVMRAGAVYFSSYRLLCPDESVPCTSIVDGTPVQWDYGHLTAEGSIFVIKKAVEAGVFGNELGRAKND